MDPIGTLIRIATQRRPTLGHRLQWMRDWRNGDPAVRVVEALVRKGDVVVDVGANWGYVAANLARLVGPAGHLHVIEPGPRNWASLEAIRARRRNVTVYPVGLSDHEGEATLHVPIVDGKAIGFLATLSLPAERPGIAHEPVPVKLTRLDSLLPVGGPPVAFIKCDVEGHELAVLRGGDATLRRSLPPLLIEIEQRHQKTDIQETFDHLAGLGYAGYALHEDGLRPLDEFDLQRDQLAFLTGDFVTGGMPRGYVHDFLFVRPGTRVTPLLAPRT